MEEIFDQDTDTELGFSPTLRRAINPRATRAFIFAIRILSLSDIAALAAGSLFLEFLKNNYSDQSSGRTRAQETGNDKLSNKLWIDYFSRSLAMHSHAESLLAPATSDRATRTTANWKVKYRNARAWERADSLPFAAASLTRSRT